MDISFSFFWSQVTSNPVVLITVLLTLGVIFVNGWTDAPNAIATCISTRSMGVRSAILMSAAFNFLGVLVMTLLNSSVAMTITDMVNFQGHTDMALIALCAAMFAIVPVGGPRRGTSAFPPARATRSSPGSRARPSRCRAAFRALTARSGSRSSTAWCSPRSSASSWATSSASWSRSSAGGSTGAGPTASSRAHRSLAARPCPSCTARRTARSSWAF